MSTLEETGAVESAAGEQGGAGTRWKRFAGMLGLTTAFTAGLVALTAQGVLAANFSISGMPFTVVATELNGTGFEQFAAMDVGVKGNPWLGEEGSKAVVVSAIDDATLTNLCQSISLGGTNLVITAGNKGTPVHATSLVVDSEDIAGNATFTDIEVGRDAGTFDRVKDRFGNPDSKKFVRPVDPETGKVVIGMFGQQAKTVNIKSLRQTNYATTASTFTLPHLAMSFTEAGCP